MKMPDRDTWTIWYNIVAFLVVATTCLADGSKQEPDPLPMSGITKTYKEMRVSDGKIYATTETVYRGKERILYTIKYTGHRPQDVPGSGWRIYYVYNRAVMFETDKQGDGSNIIVTVGADLEKFEEFIRHVDGTVEPVSDEDLAESRQERDREVASMELMVDIIKESMDSHTNVVDTLEDIRKKADVLKKFISQQSPESRE